MQGHVLGAAGLHRRDLRMGEATVVQSWVSRELVGKTGFRLDFAQMSPLMLAEHHAGVRPEASS